MLHLFYIPFFTFKNVHSCYILKNKTQLFFTKYAHTMSGYISKNIFRLRNTIAAKCLNYNFYNAWYEHDAWSRQELISKIIGGTRLLAHGLLHLLDQVAFISTGY